MTKYFCRLLALKNEPVNCEYYMFATLDLKLCTRL